MDMEKLKEQVKLNCTISDARFWGYYSICGLLMRLRELYRSEKSLMPWDKTHGEGISEWIAATEGQWKSLEHEDFRPIEIRGAVYDPFDADGLNALLNQEGFVYGGGFGRFNKPTFFLARLERKRELYDYLIYYSGQEICRDLSTSVAMLQGRCIFMRLEALKTLLWDKLQELQGRRYGGLLKQAFSSRGIEGREPPEALNDKIDALCSEVSELFVLHETGEAFEDEHSDEWFEILRGNTDRAVEFYVRGVKDLLADTSEKGPLRYIIEKRNESLLNFHMAFLDGIRKEIFPEIMNAFQNIADGGDWSLLEDARRTGYRRAEELRAHIIRLWKQGEAEKIVPEIKRSQQEKLNAPFTPS
jgi:hypothetical protein